MGVRARHETGGFIHVFLCLFILRGVYICFCVLESSGTYFDLVASKIGAKRNNLVIYGEILVNFLKMFSTKSAISQKLNIAKL